MTTRRVAGCVFWEPDAVDAPKDTPYNAYLGLLLAEMRDAVREHGEGAILTVAVDALEVGTYPRGLVMKAFDIAVNTFCVSKKGGDND